MSWKLLQCLEQLSLSECKDTVRRVTATQDATRQLPTEHPAQREPNSPGPSTVSSGKQALAEKGTVQDPSASTQDCPLKKFLSSLTIDDTVEDEASLAVTESWVPEYTLVVSLINSHYRGYYRVLFSFLAGLLWVLLVTSLTVPALQAEFSFSEAVALILAIPWSLQPRFNNYFF